MRPPSSENPVSCIRYTTVRPNVAFICQIRTSMLRCYGLVTSSKSPKNQLGQRTKHESSGIASNPNGSRFAFATLTDDSHKPHTAFFPMNLLSPVFAIRKRLLSICVLLLVQGLCTAGDSGKAPTGWSTESPRDEIRPTFLWTGNAGPDGNGALTIRADDRDGLAGWWTNQTRVQGNAYYHFSVARKTTGVDLPRRTAIARIVWLDDAGQSVKRADPAQTSYRKGEPPRAEPDFPKPKESTGEWTTLEGLYQAPPLATQAKVELHLRWGPPGSEVSWSVPSLTKTSPPSPRRVRLATVHYQPKAGTTPKEKREQFAPLIAEAAAKKVDLVVLPETLTYYRTPGTYADVAESIPGPSTDYFGSLAKEHDLYVVAGLIERDEHLIYNVAVLLGPDGKLIGKYRKVTLPRSEIEGGVTPGNQYPVFDTRFGKVGMMICYDGFFPEVARELTNRGAEVIAWPVWGCNPLLAEARACENHVYVISSTYTDSDRDWMLSAVYGHDGKPLVQADEFGSLAIAEVDLNQPLYWHSLGNFQAQIQAHRPLVDARP